MSNSLFIIPQKVKSNNMFGQMVNYKDMAKECGISEVTAKKWLTVLQDMDVIYQS